MIKLYNLEVTCHRYKIDTQNIVNKIFFFHAPNTRLQILHQISPRTNSYSCSFICQLSSNTLMGVKDAALNLLVVSL